MSKSKRYPNLYRVTWTPNWVFRKYSSTKKAEFGQSTGIEATDANAATAYRVGLEKFNEWVGAQLHPGRAPLVRDIARIVLASKAAKGKATQLKARVEITRHILPYFGHLRPSQVTALRLQEYENQVRKHARENPGTGRTNLFNTRKYLMEILRRARDEGLIKVLPTWKPSDPEAEAPRFIDAATFRRIRRRVVGPEKLVLFILYYQGARPREVLQYRWEMIRWEKDGATIEIPAAITKTKRARTIPLNSRVARALRSIRKERGPIFPMKGKPDQPRRVYDRGWLEATAALGLEFSVYNLRDSMITRSLQKGVSDVYIARYVDSSVEIIAKRYAVPVSEVMRKIAG